MSRIEDFYHTDKEGNIKLAVDPAQVLKVKDPLPIPKRCDFCGGDVAFMSNDYLYAGKLYGDWPFAYVCKGCRAYVGVHPRTDIPLGTLADKDTREARIHGKNVFKMAAERNKLSRNAAYKLLADAMQIPTSKCHFAMFNVHMCNKAERLIVKERVLDPVTVMSEKLKALFKK